MKMVKQKRYIVKDEVMGTLMAQYNYRQRGRWGRFIKTFNKRKR